MKVATTVTTLALVVAPLALTGCNSASCTGNQCRVKLDKPGQQMLVGERSERYRDRDGKRRTRKVGGRSVRLVAVTGPTAQLTVAGRSVTCTQGVPTPYDGGVLTCTKVGPGVELTLPKPR